uniref:Uncharacterized protein n=1 Tax=Anguilla anguilla TaxID=7936 RepID=A0A0E9WAT9_ANGAN
MEGGVGLGDHDFQTFFSPCPFFSSLSSFHLHF